MAQLVEQRIRNAWVAGSSPARGSLFFRKPCLHLPKILFAREISTSVVHGLPKPVRRVRLPYLAPFPAKIPLFFHSTPASRKTSPESVNLYARFFRFFDIRYRYFLYLCIRFQKDMNSYSNRYEFLLRKI